MQDDDNLRVNPSSNKPICSQMATKISRRQALKITAAGVAATQLPVQGQTKNDVDSFLPFNEIPTGQSSDIKLAEGFKYKNLISFGDPLKEGMTAYDPKKLTGKEQQNRLGGACDYTHFFEDPKDPNKGILCLNNESPEWGEHPNKKERELAAYYSVGCSVISVKRNDKGNWQPDLKSPLNKKIHPATKAKITGPAAGSDRLKSTASPDGIQSAGTLGNCAGGFTPWGTYLTAEENIQNYFTGDVKKHPEKENMKRFGMRGKNHYFKTIDKRFDLDSDAQSPLHFGWVVEIDPYNPDAPIRKHSMLGRGKHECATVTIDKDGHAVVYTSDDQYFEYLYKFVSTKKYIEGNREHNMDLLESGTLYAAKFEENGKVNWLPLVFNEGKLDAKHGFKSQGDVLLDTRKAADLVGATPMDRPEDISINAKTGKVYFLMTGNRARSVKRLNSANKVARGSGHIIEMSADHHSTTADWNFLVICGQDLADNKHATFNKETSLSGRFVYPDNGEFDQNGELWICSDGYGFPGFSDGLWHCQVDGQRGLSRRFATAPTGAEFTGPCFTKNGKELFLAVQHPKSHKGGSFPDFTSMKARSSIVVISKA
ncbi:MAG: PhoX family phosphatase [Lentisphaeraceae bacterium]|nr:PhoX family phosphatase [Lentisphaeraceae bacterium]